MATGRTTDLNPGGTRTFSTSHRTYIRRARKRCDVTGREDSGKVEAYDAGGMDEGMECIEMDVGGLDDDDDVDFDGRGEWAGKFTFSGRIVESLNTLF